MTTFFATLAALVIVILAMSVGVIFGNIRIQGSCGGAKRKIMGEDDGSGCEHCGNGESECKRTGKIPGVTVKPRIVVKPRS